MRESLFVCVLFCVCVHVYEGNTHVRMSDFVCVYVCVHVREGE